MRAPIQCRTAVVALAMGAALSAADINLSGRVVDENEAPIRDARVTVDSPDAVRPWETITAANGTFAIRLAQAGEFEISVTRNGFYALHRRMHIDSSQELTLSITSVREVFQSVNVAEAPSPVDVTQSNNTERLTGTEVNDIPYANSHSLRNSLMLMPEILEDASGGIHINGAQENQVLYMLNGFDITNPISGQLQTVFAVEGIRSVDLASGRDTPANGKGTAGVLAINTEGGTDHFHYTTTDFIPGLSFQQGLHLGSWYPRAGISGPIVKGRAWFSDMFDTEYNQAVITGLPSGQNTRSGIAFGNLLHTQVNLTKSNILHSDFLVNFDHEGRVGLGPLSPVATTSTIDTREYFGSVRDQAYLGNGLLVELGYAHNEFITSQFPQGSNLFLISPIGEGGNYFVNAHQNGSRDEGLARIFLPQVHGWGYHQLEIGGDADRRGEHGDFRRTGYEVLDAAHLPLSETVFPIPANFHLSDIDFSSYLLDTWRVAKSFQLSLGIRETIDQRVNGIAWSPRAGFSWSPFSSHRTRISGGFTITHDQVTLDTLSRPLDQSAQSTQLTSSGIAAGPALATTFLINAPLALPRATNWTLNVDHQISKTIYASAKYLRRRGSDGFVWINTLAPDAPASLLPLPSGATGGLFELSNLRRDDYDSIQFAVRQTLSGQHEWTASYTRSRADSNALIDPNSPQPLQLLPTFVPMPWDAPNRFLAFAYLPVPGKRWSKNWSLAILEDLRTGYPFSVRQPSGVAVGQVDSLRFPMHFDLDIVIERLVTLHGYRFALRGGMNNITNQANPTAVNNVTGVPQFLQFLGDEGRHFVLRIRFFGRAETK